MLSFQLSSWTSGCASGLSFQGLVTKMATSLFPPTEDKRECLVPEKEYGNGDKTKQRYQTKMRIKLLWRGRNWTAEIIRSAFFHLTLLTL